MAITTLASVKTYLNITASTSDALLTSLIASVQKAVENFIGYALDPASYVAEYDGNGGDLMFVNNLPITAVTSLIIAGLTIPASTGYTVNGYAFDYEKIWLRGYLYTLGRKTVKVSYSAGYSVMPADLIQVANEMIALQYRERDWKGYKSKSLAGESITFENVIFSDEVKSIMTSYMRVVPV